MRTVTISVASRRAVNNRFRAALRGKAQGDYITFAVEFPYDAVRVDFTLKKAA